MRKSLWMMLALCMMLSVAACGKRPDTVDAPEGSDPKAYPHTYPDVSTDPAGRATP